MVTKIEEEDLELNDYDKIKKILREQLKISISKQNGGYLIPDKIKVELYLGEEKISSSSMAVENLEDK